MLHSVTYVKYISILHFVLNICYKEPLAINKILKEGRHAKKLNRPASFLGRHPHFTEIHFISSGRKKHL